VEQQDVHDRLLENVGRRIRELRVKAGLTQAEVAERFGTTVPNYQRIEHGLQNLTLRTIARLAVVLDARVAEFFKSPRKMNPARGRPRKNARARPLTQPSKGRSKTTA